MRPRVGLDAVEASKNTFPVGYMGRPDVSDHLWHPGGGAAVSSALAGREPIGSTEPGEQRASLLVQIIE